jgi:hypothetical protein
MNEFCRIRWFVPIAVIGAVFLCYAVYHGLLAGFGETITFNTAAALMFLAGVLVGIALSLLAPTAIRIPGAIRRIRRHLQNPKP